MALIRFELRFEGGLADEAFVDLYDVSEAIRGFDRSLALTTHLILNDKIITQAPALRGAQILSPIPEQGSWKFTAVIIAGTYTLSTAPTDTPLGNLMHSAYDYVISETLGFHVDYDQSLGQQIERLRNDDPGRNLDQNRFDSLIEKCEPAIKSMHRPIAFSETAHLAHIHSKVGRTERTISHSLSRMTFDYMDQTFVSEYPEIFEGMISSYNINTYKGRIYVPDLNRPIPFELREEARDGGSVSLITRSLTANARERRELSEKLHVRAFKKESRTGRLKNLQITQVGNYGRGDDE